MPPEHYKSFILHSKKGTALGHDNSTKDISRTNVDQFVRLLHPVHVKMSFHAYEPLALKWCTRHPVREKSIALGAMAAVRSVGLKGQIIKHHHAFLLARLYCLVDASLHVVQTGGIENEGTDFHNALIRRTAYALRNSSRSCVTFHGCQQRILSYVAAVSSSISNMRFWY